MGNREVSGQANLVEHQRIGTITMHTVPGSDGQNVITMQKTYPVSSQKQVEQWERRVKQITSKETIEVLFLPISHKYEKAGMCGSSGNLSLFFEDYAFVLEREINNREAIGRPFLETEVWYLLFNMIRAAKEFQKINEKVGDIRPKNIVINEDGQIKLISSRSHPGGLNNFERAVESRQQDVYLAPEECLQRYIKMAQYPSEVNQPTAEVFSIGVTLLQVVLLKSCGQVLYSRSPEYKINLDRLQQLRNQIQGKYCNELIELILRMTEPNPSNRIHASDVFKMLQPYEELIMNLDEFSFPRTTKQVYPPQLQQVHHNSVGNTMPQHYQVQQRYAQPNQMFYERQPYQRQPQSYEQTNLPTRQVMQRPSNVGQYRQ